MTVATQNNPGVVDEHAARELYLYATNDRDLYRQQITPINKNLITKKARGVYKTDLAVKLAMYLMENAAKKYVREHGSPGDKWSDMFNVPTRREAAKEFVEMFEGEAALGNYDSLLPAKYKKNPATEATGAVGNPRSGDKEYTVLIHPRNSQSKESSKQLRVFGASKDRAVAQARAQVRTTGRSDRAYTYQALEATQANSWDWVGAYPYGEPIIRKMPGNDFDRYGKYAVYFKRKPRGKLTMGEFDTKEEAQAALPRIKQEVKDRHGWKPNPDSQNPRSSNAAAGFQSESSLRSNEGRNPDESNASLVDDLETAFKYNDSGLFNNAYGILARRLKKPGSMQAFHYLQQTRHHFQSYLKGHANAEDQFYSYWRDLRSNFAVRNTTASGAVGKRKANATANDFVKHQKIRLEELARLFQGQATGEKRRVLESDYTPKKKYRLGHLKLLKIKDGGKIIPIIVDGDEKGVEAYVAADLRNNLLIVGRDARMENIRLPKKGFLRYLGELIQIDYVTAKKHIGGGKLIHFYHKLGEVTGEHPNLFVDDEGCLIIQGGGYDVWDVGIVN